MRGCRYLDAGSILTVYLVLLFFVESRLGIPGLGGAGNPAVLLGCAGFGWWVFYHAQRPVRTGNGRQPLRFALLVLLVAFLLSYVAAMSRPISGIEAGTANLGLVGLVGLLGVALLLNDGVQTFDRFNRLIDRVVLFAAAVAVLGILQFLTNDPLLRSFQVPGLVPNAPLGGLTMRSGFSRPFGTALHPIEFGAVITTVLPLAITRARLRTRHRLVHWLPVAFLGMAVLLSISRSAVVCGVCGLAVLAIGWDARARLALLGAIVAAVVVVAVTVPSMLGSLTALFVQSSDDGSVASRTGSYPMAWEFFSTSPVFGRGYSTFLPMYRIFDNQYLLLLVEVGLAGLVAVMTVLGTAIYCAAHAGRLSAEPSVRAWSRGLIAAIAAGALGLAFYDGFSFPMASGVLFVALGLAGALRRLVIDGEVRDADSRRIVRAPR